jgi:hypothetical protein
MLKKVKKKFYPSDFIPVLQPNKKKICISHLKKMFYDQVSNTLARSLTGQTVSDLHFEKDGQRVPKQWSDPCNWRREFWDHVIQEWGLPVNPQRIQLEHFKQRIKNGKTYGKKLIIVLRKMPGDDGSPPLYTPPSKNKKLVRGDASLDDIFASGPKGSPRDVFFVSDNIQNANHPAVAHGFNFDLSLTVKNVEAKYIAWLERVGVVLGSEFVEIWVDGPRLYFFTQNPFLLPLRFVEPSKSIRPLNAEEKGPFMSVFFANDTIANYSRDSTEAEGFTLREKYDLNQVKEAYCAWSAWHNHGVAVKCHSCWEQDRVKMFVDGENLYFFLGETFQKRKKNQNDYGETPSGKFSNFTKILNTPVNIFPQTATQPYHGLQTTLKNDDTETWFKYMTLEHPNFCFDTKANPFIFETISRRYSIKALTTEEDPVEKRFYPSQAVSPDPDGRQRMFITKDNYYFTPNDVHGTAVAARKIDGHKVKQQILQNVDGYVDRTTRPWKPIPPVEKITINLRQNPMVVVVPATYLEIRESLFMNEVNACPHRFVIKPLTLFGLTPPNEWTDDPLSKLWSHANVLIMDKKTGVLTRYEPHGASTGLYDYTLLDHLLSEFVKNYPRVFFGGYEPPLQFCPLVGVQTLAENAYKSLNPQTKYDEKGTELKEKDWCAAFSAMFAHYRVANPELTTTEIARNLTSKNGVQLSNDVRSYMNFMILNTKPEEKKEDEHKDGS